MVAALTFFRWQTIFFGVAHTALGIFVAAIHLLFLEDGAALFPVVQTLAKTFDCGLDPLKNGTELFCSSVAKNNKTWLNADVTMRHTDLGIPIIFYFIVTGLMQLYAISPLRWEKTSSNVEEGKTLCCRWASGAFSYAALAGLLSYFAGFAYILEMVLIVALIFSAYAGMAMFMMKKERKGFWFHSILPLAQYILALALVFGMFVYWINKEYEELPSFVWALLIGELILFNILPAMYVAEHFLSDEEGVLNESIIYRMEFLYNLADAAAKIYAAFVVVFFVFM